MNNLLSKLWSESFIGKCVAYWKGIGEIDRLRKELNDQNLSEILEKEHPESANDMKDLFGL